MTTVEYFQAIEKRLDTAVQNLVLVSTINRTVAESLIRSKGKNNEWAEKLLWMSRYAFDHMHDEIFEFEDLEEIFDNNKNKTNGI